MLASSMPQACKYNQPGSEPLIDFLCALHPGPGPNPGWATAAQRWGGSPQLWHLHGLPFGAALPLPCSQHDAAGPLHLQHVHRPAHPLFCVSERAALDLCCEMGLSFSSPVTKRIYCNLCNRVQKTSIQGAGLRFRPRVIGRSDMSRGALLA